uniref:Putative product n=1 Tax=Xenopsylla cheopis TaxID=163159 RepID=A0A6M2DWE9_XENCH
MNAAIALAISFMQCLSLVMMLLKYLKCSTSSIQSCISCHRYLQWMILFRFRQLFRFFVVYFHVLLFCHLDDSIQHRQQRFLSLRQNYQIVCILYGINLHASHCKVSDVYSSASLTSHSP